MPDFLDDERDDKVSSVGPGHEAYSREHALWHVWKASRYYAAHQAFAEMLKIEEKQHQTENRTARIQVLRFSQSVLDNLVENELLEVHKELTTHLLRSGKLDDSAAARRVWDELSILVGCSSPDGSAELDQVKLLKELRVP